jgi:predicted DsbA family dithiol-disulfide isomerase
MKLQYMNQTTSMPVKVKIDFVSDVSCPWCAIGLKSLEQALTRLEGKVKAELHFQPFELNPDMPAGGQDTEAYIREKYGVATSQQLAARREVIRQRGAEVGVEIGPRKRIYNTFDAHRLLHWAGIEGKQAALKEALLKSYITDDENVGDHAILVRLAGEVGLPTERAREILESDEYREAVRGVERFYVANGINGVPAIIINDRHLISGGQPVEVFEQALKQITGVA